MLDSPSAQMAQAQWSIQKNFDDCHVQFENKGGQAYCLNFMHAITPNLTIGWGFAHLVSTFQRCPHIVNLMLVDAQQRSQMAVRRPVPDGQSQVLHAV